MVIVITGPTATGKTKLSVELAKLIGGEIINADSTQVYKDMNIGTAKVTEEEKCGIPHHLFDIKNVEENYTIYDYQKDARKKISEITSRGNIPILVGGTGLYIKAALYNYEFKTEDKTYDFSSFNSQELYDKLLSFDPNTSIHINNRKRVERALTYYYNNKEIISNNKTDELLYDTIFIGLTTDREILYKKINDRVDIMIESGLIEEAKYFYNLNIKTKAITTPICYKELFMYFDNQISLDESIKLIKQRSRRYAKRQYTFFNHQLPIKWFDVDFNNFNNTIDKVYNEVKNKL